MKTTDWIGPGRPQRFTWRQPSADDQQVQQARAMFAPLEARAAELRQQLAQAEAAARVRQQRIDANTTTISDLLGKLHQVQRQLLATAR